MKTQKLLLSLLALLMVATAWGQTASIKNGTTGGTTFVAAGSDISAAVAGCGLSIDYDLSGSTYVGGTAVIFLELYTVSPNALRSTTEPDATLQGVTEADGKGNLTLNSLTWSNGTPAITTLPAGNYRLVAVIRQTGKADKRLPMLITAKALPASVTIVGPTTTPANPTCLGKKVELSVKDPVDGVVYKWTSNTNATFGGCVSGDCSKEATGAITGTSITTTATIIGSGLTGITYTVQAVFPAQANCGGVTDTHVVDFGTIAAPTLTASATTICLGSSVDLTATGACATTKGNMVEWYENGGTVLIGTQTITSPLGTSNVFTHTPNNRLNYYTARCVLPDGCLSEMSTQVTVTAETKPAAPKGYVVPTFCQGTGNPQITLADLTTATCATGTLQMFNANNITAGADNDGWVNPANIPVNNTITTSEVGTYNATITTASDNVLRTYKLRCNLNGCASDEQVVTYTVEAPIATAPALPTGLADKNFCGFDNQFKLAGSCPAGSTATLYRSYTVTESVEAPGAGLTLLGVGLQPTTKDDGTFETGTLDPRGATDFNGDGLADITYYHLTCTTTNSCGSKTSKTTVVKVTETPTVVTVDPQHSKDGGTTKINGRTINSCIDGSLTLYSNCPTGYKTTWTSTTGTVENDGELAINTAAAGTQTIVAACKGECGTSANVTFTITVGSGQTAPILTALPSLCSGNAAVTSNCGASVTQYRWRVVGGAWSTANENDGTWGDPAVQPDASNDGGESAVSPGTYQVQARCVDAGCASAWSEILTANVGEALAPPSFAAIHPNSSNNSTGALTLASACAGSTIKLVLNQGYTCPGTLTWYTVDAPLGSGRTAIGSGNPSQNYTLPSNQKEVVFQAMCVVNNCESPLSTRVIVAVVVPPTFAASTVNPTNNCLPASAVTQVKLTVTCPIGTSIATPTVTRSTNGGTQVTVNPTWVGPIPVNPPDVFLPIAAAVHQWEGTLNATAPATAGTTDRIVYRVSCNTYASIGGVLNIGNISCNDLTQTIELTTSPAAPAVTAATLTGCGTVALPAVTCANGATAEWVNAAGAVVTSPVSVSGDYKARCVKDGCAGALSTNAVTATVTPSTTAYTIKADKTTLCATGGEVVLSVATGSCPGTLTWKEGTTTLGTGATITTTPGTAATYTYSASCADGACTIASNEVTVTRETAPTISISASATVICAGTKVTLTAMPEGMAKYEWVSVTAGVSTIIATTTTNTYELASPMGSPTQYGVMVTSANGCVYAMGETGLVALTVTSVPTITFSTTANGTICAGSGIVMFLGGCPAGATYKITNGGLSDVANGKSGGSVTLNVNAVPVGGANEITYTATCTVGGAACSATATTKVMTSPIDVRWVNVGQSQTAMRPAGQGFTTTEWPTVNATSGPNAMNSSPGSRSKMDYTGPRYWNLEAFYCITATPKTVEFVLVNETTSQTFKTVEGTAPWFMFGNSRSAGSAVADSYFQLWTIDDPNYGFGSAYTANGLPKGLYTLTVRAISVPAAIPGAYPPIRVADQDPANTIVARTFYFDIAGSQAARQGISESSEVPFVSMGMNPVTRTLSFTINGAKGQEVNLNLVDAAGRSIKASAITPETNTHREEIDMSSQNTGMYFLQVTSPSKKGVLKVLKVQE